MTQHLAIHIIQQFLSTGGTDLCVCSGSRNAPLVSLLAANPQIKAYYFFEERSAAFFALGLSRRTQRPVAMITTSGTAAAELLPAMTEAYYTQVPLVAITADRPRHYRGKNAPQSCEQVGLYGVYAPWTCDIAEGEFLDLSNWNQNTPAHINVCFDEPLKIVYQGNELNSHPRLTNRCSLATKNRLKVLDDFLKKTSHPLVVVGALPCEARKAVSAFLQKINAPVYAEATSGLRECTDLEHLLIRQTAGIWESAQQSGYPIDGILRIGGIPTVRLWRDLENLEGKIHVFSVSEHPFSGLSWGDVVQVHLDQALEDIVPSCSISSESYATWKQWDQEHQDRLLKLFQEEPAAEQSWIHALSKHIQPHSLVYLGNSMPIRYWDLAAEVKDKQLTVEASRGLSGIDGQISTFLGLCQPHHSNWAILGDLTAMYDMAGLWILPQMREITCNLVVINNGGGQIFSSMYSEKQFINAHRLKFHPLAEMWGMHYTKWEVNPESLPNNKHSLIEIVPDNQATARFRQKAASQNVFAGAR